MDKNRSDIYSLLDAHIVELISYCAQVTVDSLILAHQMLYLHYPLALSLFVGLYLLPKTELTLFLLENQLLLISNHVFDVLQAVVQL